LYLDGAAAQHDHRGDGVCGVESERAAGDRAYASVQAFGPAVVDPELERGQDAGAMLADGALQLDERRQPGSLRPGDEPVEQPGGLASGQVGVEDRP
jgi:hypothetical protein